MKKIKMVAVVLLGALLFAGCGGQNKAQTDTTDSKKTEESKEKEQSVIYVPKKEGAGFDTSYELKYDKDKNVHEIIYHQTISFTESTEVKSNVLTKAEKYTEEMEEAEGITYSYEESKDEFTHDIVYKVADILKADDDGGDYGAWLVELADGEETLPLKTMEEYLQDDGYLTKEEKEEADAARKERRETEYEIKDGDVATLLKEAGYTVTLGSATSSYTHITLENLQNRVTLETIVNNNGQVHEVAYTNTREDISKTDVYYMGEATTKTEAADAYIDTIRSIGITIPAFYDFLKEFAVANFAEAAPDRVAAKDIKAMDSKVGKALVDNDYVFYVSPSDSYFTIYLSNIEAGVAMKTITTKTGVHEITYKNSEDGISGEIYYNSKHTANDNLLDQYLDFIDELGFTQDEFLEFLKTYREQYLSLKPASTEETTDAAAADTTTTSSSDTSTNTASGSSEVEAAIKKVDAKYDDMIAKAQGYVDNPSTYTDTASLTFLADYMELMTEYGKLGETISAAGDDVSSSDAMTIYTNMLEKSVKLTELYSQLS